MRAIKGKDTKPEMAVRRLVHGMGYRYRLHRKDLPGSPDLAFGPRKKAIFVHGCFWHQHECQAGRLPKTRQELWRAKFDRNRARDERNVAALGQLGWDVLTVWECQLKGREALGDILASFLAAGEA